MHAFYSTVAVSLCVLIMFLKKVEIEKIDGGAARQEGYFAAPRFTKREGEKKARTNFRQFSRETNTG